MVLFQIGPNGEHYNKAEINFTGAKFVNSYYLKHIVSHLNDLTPFEAYRHIDPYFQIDDGDAYISAVEIIFQFFEDSRNLRIRANVLVGFTNAQNIFYPQKCMVEYSKIEVARILAQYFATSLDERGCEHSLNTPQSTYWHFIKWAKAHFSDTLAGMDIEDQEVYLSALHSAYSTLANDPRMCLELPKDRAFVHWMERRPDEKCWDENHFLFATNGNIYHYSPCTGVLFDEVP